VQVVVSIGMIASEEQVSVVEEAMKLTKIEPTTENAFD